MSETTRPLCPEMFGVCVYDERTGEWDSTFAFDSAKRRASAIRCWSSVLERNIRLFPIPAEVAPCPIEALRKIVKLAGLTGLQGTYARIMEIAESVPGVAT